MFSFGFCVHFVVCHSFCLFSWVSHSSDKDGRRPAGVRWRVRTCGCFSRAVPLPLCVGCLCCPVASNPKRRWICAKCRGLFTVVQKPWGNANGLTPSHKLNVNLRTEARRKSYFQCRWKLLKLLLCCIVCDYFQSTIRCCMICICMCTSVYTWKCSQWQVCMPVMPVVHIYRYIIKIHFIPIFSKDNDVLCSLHIQILIPLLFHSLQVDRAGGKVSHKCHFPAPSTEPHL